MEAAKSQMEEAEKVRLQTQTKLELYKEQYKADKEAYDILSPQMEKRGKIIEKHTKLETLYKLLSGNMSGNITWRRFFMRPIAALRICLPDSLNFVW